MIRTNRGEARFKITKSSTIENRFDLSQDELMLALNAHKYPETAKFWKEIILEEGLVKYGKDETAAWQLRKSDEIRNLFNDNLKLLYTPESITLSTEYIVSLPKNWNRGDILEWAGSFNTLWCDYLDYSMEETVKSKRPETYHRMNIIFNDKDGFKNNEKTIIERL